METDIGVLPRPTFPLHVGSLRIPPGWIRVVNALEAAAASASPSAGLVVLFQGPHRFLCYRVETYDAMRIHSTDFAYASK